MDGTQVENYLGSVHAGISVMLWICLPMGGRTYLIVFGNK